MEISAMLTAAVQSIENEPPKGTIVATYNYVDDEGEVLYQVCRLEPKSFRQRRPDGKGGWIWSVKDCRRIPYRLPDLLQYPDATVFVCEGEKDADRVASLDHCATTVAGGDWTPDCTSPLAGRNCLILEDNDDAGRKKAHEAAQALHGVASTVRIVRLPDLPEKGDVSDWLDADTRNAGKLADVCFDAPLWTPDTPAPAAAAAPSSAGTWRDNVFTAAALRTMKFKVIEYLVPGIIPEGLTILAGKPKIGKSWLALDLALAVTGDRFMLGEMKPVQGDVLYAALEDNQRRLWKRTRKIMDTAHVAWPEGLTLATQWRRLDEGGIGDIKDWATSVSSPRLVILDTLAGIRPERNNRDTLYDGDYKALRELHDWANEVGIAVVVLHHTRKMEADDPIDTISGSLGLAGCADTSAILSRSSKGTTLYIRGRDVEEQEHAVLFNAQTCRWTILGDAAAVQQSYTQAKILTALDEATDLMTPADISYATQLSRNIVDQRLHHLVKNGNVIKVSRGSYAHAKRPELVSRTPHKKRKP
jgi:DNA-binding MarR family transcriptional regulator